MIPVASPPAPPPMANPSTPDTGARSDQAPAGGAGAQADAAATRRAEDLLIRIAQLQHRYGAPAHRQERLLFRMAESLGVQAQFLVTPTSLLLAFGQGLEQRAYLLRVEARDVDLGRLVEFDELLEAVEDGELSIAEARARLDEFDHCAPRYGGLVTSAAAGLASASSAVFFGGAWHEVGATFALGVGANVLMQLFAGKPDGPRMVELAMSFAAAFAAVLLAQFGNLSTGVVTLASLIVLVPGLTLTVAMIELATGHLVSGTARLFGALTTFLTLTLGVALGRLGAESLLGWLERAPLSLPYDPTPLATGWWLLALTVSPTAFAILFQARVQELGWIFVASVGGFLGARYGTEALGPELGSFAGALVVGLVANIFARVADRPATVPLTPGILLLVPGSIGFQALDLFLARDALAGMENAFRVAIVATSLVGGLLVSNVLVPPRRSL